MAKRLTPDLDEMCPDAGRRGCRGCSERLSCDDCNRPVCFYVKIELYEDGEPINEIRCRPCMEDYSKADLETGAYDISRLEPIKFED